MEASRLIVNCLPLTAEERDRFLAAAPDVRQEFVGVPEQRGAMVWKAVVPEGLRAGATAVIGNVPAADAGDYPRLEWIQTWSAGVDQYLRPGVLADGVMVTSASGAYGQSVSEHLFALMWALMRHLPAYRDQQREGRWADLGRAVSPVGATVLVIGTGDIGSHFARLAHAVGSTVLGVRRDPSKPAEGFDGMFGFDQLDELLPSADVVVSIVPSSPTTHHLLDAGRLALMRPGAIVLNGGRGDAVDPDALLEALRAGAIAGAGLDVTEPEPLPADHPLWREPRCVITPHVAGGMHLEATEDRIIDIALGNVGAYAAGRPLSNRRR
ncbi:2-hydroxyacid dehydrogenase [Bifidobacterium sp. DSM 109958]|uniref:2-hydroxyacid dehydrogenase n=1 Tax=Bifidobacterium moraviense TaxID=2675323 RepID=A0A7Y0EZV9_9BIFI|nr:D-2-hydroxyacid dehydrogenase [Bifidobacterium sp. DSM 109958]NMM99441.1 2-hydroxyacid dehydrogenase [Bifidobacterium sp. DSM 109958]